MTILPSSIVALSSCRSTGMKARTKEMAAKMAAMMPATTGRMIFRRLTRAECRAASA
ncbi:hypothetical protein D3C85_1863870 [compost metagenome]